MKHLKTFWSNTQSIINPNPIKYTNLRGLLQGCLVGAIVKHTPREPTGSGSRLSFASFFYFGHAQWFHVMQTWFGWRHYSPSHMFCDVQIIDLEFDSEGFSCLAKLYVWPWLDPFGRESWPCWDLMGLGVFLRKGETACTRRRNWCTSSRKKGKRTASTPQGRLWPTLKENFLLDPCWFSGNPLWGVPLFLGLKLARGLTVPRTGDSTAWGTRQNSGGFSAGESPSPPTGLGARGKMAPAKRTGWKETKPESNQKKRKRILARNNIYRSRILEVPHIMIHLHIIIMHLHLIYVRVSVGVNPNPYFNSHGTSCHGNLLFTRSPIGRVFELIFNPLFEGCWWSFLRVSKCNSILLRVSQRSSYFETQIKLHQETQQMWNTKDHTHDHNSK